MVFVILGTQNKDFSRCLKMVEELIKEKRLTESVVAQTGYTNYNSSYINCIDFISESEFLKYIEESDVIITHAGSGALFSAIKTGKKVIAVARLRKYGEMLNDHQTQLVRKLSEMGYILDGTYDLLAAWDKLDGFMPTKDGFTNTVSLRIEEILDDWGVKKKYND